MGGEENSTAHQLKKWIILPCQIMKKLKKMIITIHPQEPCEITEESSSTVESKKPLSGKRVLLVDDDYVIRIVGSKVLSKLGAEVVMAKNGFEALNLVKKALEIGLTRGKNGDYSFTYDVIFMDCQMPVMDGYEAARQIRTEESRYGIHIPIITVSADASDEDVQKAVAAGMDRHLQKPLDERKVVDFFFEETRGVKPDFILTNIGYRCEVLRVRTLCNKCKEN